VNDSIVPLLDRVAKRQNSSKIFMRHLFATIHSKTMELIGLFLSIGLLIYLIIALIQPERFS
jgi:K+-transporting ATPase KdpF subunit